MSYKKALRQLRAIERSKAMSEDTLSELEQLHMYKKYDLGIDNVEDKTKGHENIIGHTWATHVKRKGSALDEIGFVVWHSLNEGGDIDFYDVEWNMGNIETDIPATMLEVVKDSNAIDEVHEGHGVQDPSTPKNERKYKSKK